MELNGCARESREPGSGNVRVHFPVGLERFGRDPGGIRLHRAFSGRALIAPIREEVDQCKGNRVPLHVFGIHLNRRLPNLHHDGCLGGSGFVGGK